MSALTAARNTPQQGGGPVIGLLAWPMKASTKCYQGGLVVSNAGYAAPGTAATGLECLGVALATADNTGGSNGAITVMIARGTFEFNNSGGGDAIAQASLPCPVYIVDDNTVALTDGNGTRSLAGNAVMVDSQGVWVEIGMGALVSQPLAPDSPTATWSVSVPLANLANSGAINMTPGFAGRIKSFMATVTSPATTSGKAATVTPAVGAVGGPWTNVTGGALALTSANCTPFGAEVDAATITGANTFTASQQLALKVSSVTTFIEGTVNLTLVFG